MSATSAPFGLRPAFHPSGIIRPTAMSIESGYNANILQFQPVKIGASGTIEAAAATEAAIVGTFMGVEFTDTDGRRRVSNKWTAATSATDIVAYVTTDPAIVYEIQANSSLVITDIGSQADFASVTAGSTTTGLSAAMLDAAQKTSSGNEILRIVNLGTEIDNAWGDAYTIVQVQISEHQFVADKAAF
jgi:hypothetical protein